MSRIVNAEEWESLCKTCNIVTSATPREIESYVKRLQDVIEDLLNKLERAREAAR